MNTLTTALQVATETPADPTFLFLGFFAIIAGLLVYWKFFKNKP